jgi:transposase
LGSQAGRLVLREFSDPGRPASLDPTQVRAQAAAYGVQLHPAVAHCLVGTARVALAGEPAAAARVVLAQDLDLLEVLEGQVTTAEQRLANLVGRTRFAVLTTTPGRSAVRAAGYAAAVGDLARWPSHRQAGRSAGLPPVVYASAGRRRDGPISREGSVELRRALLGLGVGLWRHDPPARAWATQLRARGKAKGVVATAWPTGPVGSRWRWSGTNSHTNPTAGGSRATTTAWSGRWAHRSGGRS